MKFKAKILVVDDDVPVCKSIQSALEESGFVVETALSGESALQKEAADKFSVMIVDLMMPGINGLDLLEAVKKRTPDITIIMITGYPSIKTAVESIKLGAFDFIPKPFTPKELVGMVNRALERRYIYEEKAKEMGLDEEKLVEVDMPADLHCIPENSWAKIDSDGNIRVGVHHVFLRTVKDLQSVNLPNKGEFKYQGDSCFTVTDTKGSEHRVWAPVTGKILEINTALQNDCQILLNDPYETGWVMVIEPTQLKDDLDNLTKLSIT